MFIKAVFTILKMWTQPKCPPVHKQIKKPRSMYAMECYLAIKKDEILLFVTGGVGLEGTVLPEINQRKTNTI